MSQHRSLPFLVVRSSCRRQSTAEANRVRVEIVCQERNECVESSETLGRAYNWCQPCSLRLMPHPGRQPGQAAQTRPARDRGCLVAATTAPACMPDALGSVCYCCIGLRESYARQEGKKPMRCHPLSYFFGRWVKSSVVAALLLGALPAPALASEGGVSLPGVADTAIIDSTGCHFTSLLEPSGSCSHVTFVCPSPASSLIQGTATLNEPDGDLVRVTFLGAGANGSWTVTGTVVDASSSAPLVGQVSVSCTNITFRWADL